MSVNLCQCAMRSIIVQPIVFSVGERLGGGGSITHTNTHSLCPQTSERNANKE